MTHSRRRSVLGPGSQGRAARDRSRDVRAVRETDADDHGGRTVTFDEIAPAFLAEYAAG
ncbi:MAG: hypothetical protein ABEJ23_03685 [Haloarculaceae archaeon]